MGTSIRQHVIAECTVDRGLKLVMLPQSWTVVVVEATLIRFRGRTIPQVRRLATFPRAYIVRKLSTKGGHKVDLSQYDDWERACAEAMFTRICRRVTAAVNRRRKLEEEMEACEDVTLDPFLPAQASEARSATTTSTKPARISTASRKRKQRC